MHEVPTTATVDEPPHRLVRDGVSKAATVVLVLSVVGYPLIAPISLLLEVPNRIVSIPFRAVIVVCAALVVVSAIRSRRYPTGAFWFVWWLFWGLYLARILVDGILDPAALRLSLTEHIAYAAGMSLLPAVALSTRLDPNVLRRSVIYMIVVGAIASLAALWMIAQQAVAYSVFDLAGGRQELETLSPIGLSHLGVTTAILALWVVVSNERQRLVTTALLLACAFLGIATALAGASRGPIVAFGAVSPFLIVIALRRLSLGLLLKGLMTGTLLAVGIAFAADRIERLMAFGRLRRMILGGDASVNVRMDFYRDGMQAFLERPILGAGTEPLGIYPHNVILESFMMFGVVSGILFSALIIFAIVAAIRLFRMDESPWVSLLLFQYIIGAMFSFSLYTNSAMWCLMALAVGRLYHVTGRPMVSVFGTPGASMKGSSVASR